MESHGHLTRRALAAKVGAGGGLLAVTALAACGQGTASPATPAQPSKVSGKITLLVRKDPVENQGQNEVLIPTFKQAAPDVEVVQEVAPNGTTPYNEKLMTMWSAGSAPDVWGFGMNYMAYWARGMVAELDPLIARDKLDLDQFLPGLADRFKVHGKHYGLPQLTTFGTLLFYNKNLFDNAGIKYPTVDWDDKTWSFDAMLDVARKLTKSPGASDAVYGLSYSAQLPTSLPWSFGGDAFMPEHYTNGIAPASQLDSPPSVAAHEWYQDLQWKHHVSQQTGKDPSVGGFAGGRVAMYIGGGYNFWSFSPIKDFKWAAAAIPTKVTNKNVNYNDNWELAKESKNRDAAWAFIKHCTSPETQKQYSQLTGTPPTTKAALDVWYKRYDSIMPQADLEKLTKGAIDPKRTQESPDHLFVDWSRFDEYYKAEVRAPIDKNEGTPRDVVARAKQGYDSLMKDVYNTWKGKTPS